MSLRHGLTADEEKKLQRLIEKGVTWEDIVEHQNDQDAVPHFIDVDMKYIHDHLYKPMLRTHELRKKLGAGLQKAIDIDKKWVDISKDLAAEKLSAEDLELVRKFIYAPARQKRVDAEKKRKAAEAE